MRSLLIIFLFITTSLFAQTVDFKVNGGKTSIYRDAVTHYIDSIHHSGKLTFDTLFILSNEELSENVSRNINGLINKINVAFLDTAKMPGKLKYHRSLNALNMGTNQNSGKERITIWIIPFLVTKDDVKIIYAPLNSCSVNYFYNNVTKEFEFKKIVCGN